MAELQTNTITPKATCETNITTKMEKQQQYDVKSVASAMLSLLDPNSMESFSVGECVDKEMDDDFMPKKQQNLFEPHSLSPQQQTQLHEALNEMPWTPTEGLLNYTTMRTHRIDTGTELPFRQRQFNMSPYMERKVGAELQRLLERGIIKRIPFSEWRNRIVPVSKKDGSVRLCLDARELNKRTRRSTYPQMDMNRIISRIQDTTYLSALDLGEAFFQVKLSDDSCIKTAFAIAPFGYFCFDRMPMGCVNSSAALCELIDKIFGLEFEGKCFWYVDDLLIASRTFDEHMRLIKLHRAGLTVSQKVSAITQMQRPETVKQIQSFLGMTGFFRRFIDRYSHMAAPLNELIKGKPTKI